MDQKKPPTQYILLSRMFAGSYLDNDNIGHEVINLIRPDDNKDDKMRHYCIYVSPHGTLGKSKVEKITNHPETIQSILLVRGINASKVEVLAKAVGCILEKPDDHNPPGANVKYGGVTLQRIYGDKVYDEKKRREQADSQSAYVTFRVKQILKPKKQMFLVTKKSVKSHTDKPILCNKMQTIVILASRDKLSTRSLYTFIENSEEQKQDFNTLDNLIKNQRFWKNKTRLNPVSLDAADEKPCFLEIIGKIHDEVSFSNLFAYYLNEDKEMLKRFMKEVLNCTKIGEPKVRREVPVQVKQKTRAGKKNKRTKTTYKTVGYIDLLVEDENNLIVIENKINSDINGKDDDFEKNAKQGKTQETQLTRYARFARDHADGRTTKFFVFSPNYNVFEKSELTVDGRIKIKQTNPRERIKYKPVNYSELLAFFRNKKHKKRKEEIAYFDDFITALGFHVGPVDNQNEKKMVNRFGIAVRQALEAQNKKTKQAKAPSLRRKARK